MIIEAERGSRLVDIPRIVEAVPNYSRFMTGRELVDSTRRLLEDHSKMVENGTLGYEILGKSTEGRDIDLLRVGNGKKIMLWVGTPHPNEPVGTLAIDFTSRYLCEHPEVLESMDTTALFIKNADPDGLELNKSWLKEEMDPLKYALGFYRPPFEEQVEWGFPIEYKSLKFDKPPKETQAVKQAIDTYQPDFLYSLHNSAFGGSYYCLTPRIDPLLVPLQENIKKNGLPLYAGAAEVPYVEKWTLGIFEAQTTKKMYEYFKDNLDGDPKDFITGGAGMSEYLRESKPHNVSLISETPFFTAAALDDTNPSGLTRRDAIVQGAQARRAIIAYTKAQLNSLGALPDSRLKRAAEGNLEMIGSFIDSSVKNSEKDEYGTEATVAEVYKEVQVNSYYQLIQLGQVYRLAIEAGEVTKAEEIKKYISNGIDDINKISPIQVLPIQNLVRAQVGAGLLAMQYAA